MLREVLARECARVGDPGAAIPGADPDDGHGWHPWSPDQPAQPRRPGAPVFHPECWRYFRLLDLGWLQNTLLVSFAWDELGTPNLTYTTPITFLPALQAHGARALALTARGHLRWLLAPNDLAVRLSPNPAATPLDPGEHWRERCGRLWLGPAHVLVFPGPAPDQHDLERHWQLPWPSLTNPTP